MEVLPHTKSRPSKTTWRVFAALLLLSAGLILGFVTRGWLENLDKPRGVQWEFVEAARIGNVNRLEQLYKQGAKIDCEWVSGGVSGFTALSDSVDSLQVDSVRWLLEHGADPDDVISDGTPRGGARYNQKKAQEIVLLMQQYPPKQRDEQVVPSDGQKPPSHASPAGPTAPADAH